MPRTTGTFDVTLTPQTPGPAGWATMDIDKTWHGGIEGVGRGLMLSAGDPGAGTAGFVALETIEGTVDGGAGTFAFQQFGTMDVTATRHHYEIVPGTGTGALAGIAGTLELTVDDDGVHRYALDYTLP